MKRILPFIPLAIGAFLVVLFATYGLHHDPHVYPKALMGKPVPQTALAPLQGGQPEPVMTALNGPGVVNLFASWCAPCAQEAPQLLKLKAAGVPMVGVAYRDKTIATQGFLDKYGNPFATILQDPTGDAGVDFGISGVPETFVVDRHGMVVAKYVSPLSDKEVQEVADLVDQLRTQGSKS